MSNQQNFSETLLRQINDLNSRNLALQSQLAQKKDQLNNTSRLLQNAMFSPPLPPPPSIQPFQQHIFKLQQQLQSAQEVNATSKLRFDSLYNDQQKHMSNVNNELALTKAELARMRSNYAALDRQLRAVKSDQCRQSNRPAPAPEKPYQQLMPDDDEDDEETLSPGVKSEPKTSVSGTGSGIVLGEPQLSFAASSTTSHPSTKRLSLQSVKTQRNLRLPGRKKAPSTSSTSNRNRSSRIQLKDKIPVRKSSSVTSSQPWLKKRKHRHSAEEEVADEPGELEIFDLTASQPNRKRSCTLSTSTATTISPEELKEQALHELAQRFCFTAVVRYDEQPGVEEFYESRDIKDRLGELWDAIGAMEEMWWEARGEDWKFEFEEKLKNRPASSCISTKLKIEGWKCGKNVWMPGCEGKFACKKCVEQVKPCFIWNGEAFRLLPLHEDDRVFELKPGFEVRYWLNVE